MHIYAMNVKSCAYTMFFLFLILLTQLKKSPRWPYCEDLYGKVNTCSLWRLCKLSHNNKHLTLLPTIQFIMICSMYILRFTMGVRHYPLKHLGKKMYTDNVGIGIFLTYPLFPKTRIRAIIYKVWVCSHQHPTQVVQEITGANIA